jgi:hypothetical protein
VVFVSSDYYFGGNTMIKLPGTLIIRIINGKYGDFRVGQLLTEIGEFAVKDPMFDQYDEGRYEGDFVISKIYIGPYTVSNRVVVQLCADIDSVVLSSAAVEQQEDEAFEQDPIEKEQSLSSSDPETSTETQLSDQSETASLEDESSTDEGDLGYESTTDADSDEAKLRDLFGLLWPLGQSVKLDSTVDRSILRQQRDKLDELGYTFKAVGQVWSKTE